MKTTHSRLDATAMSAMVVCCALWGLQQVAIKVANVGISPVLQAGLRSAGAAALLWAWSAWRGVKLVERDAPLGLGLVVGLLFALEFALLYWALIFTTASRSVLFLYTSPFAVAVGAHFFVPGERLRRTQILGLACAFIGIAVAFGDALRFPTSRELIGDLMVTAAAMVWGATTVVVKASRLATISPNKTLFYQLAVSAVFLPALSPMLGEPGVFDLTPLVLSSLVYQTVIVAFASYLTWFWLITRYPASRLASFSFLTPLFGLLAGALLLSEPISGALIVAMALVGLGINLVNRAPAEIPSRNSDAALSFAAGTGKAAPGATRAE